MKYKVLMAILIDILIENFLSMLVVDLQKVQFNFIAFVVYSEIIQLLKFYLTISLQILGSGQSDYVTLTFNLYGAVTRDNHYIIVISTFQFQHLQF